MRPAILALEDGLIFNGLSIGNTGTTCGTLVFNTAMSGYQEILTDPSYDQQLICFTAPHIGNVGFNEADMESNTIHCKGLITKTCCHNPSNYRAQKSLLDALNQYQVIGITHIDTRALTHHLRTQGALNGCITTEFSDQEAIALAQNTPQLIGQNLIDRVSTTVPYPWQQPTWQHHTSPSTHQLTVIVIDYGVKRNILRCLVDQGFSVHVVPHHTSVETLLTLKPDGIVLSNGPGDPETCHAAHNLVKELLAIQVPLLGICLGHQILALACGAHTFKMHHGHHGANHPILRLADQRVFISSQNHHFSVEEKTLPSCLRITHRSLFDSTIAGLAHQQAPAISFQGHPEASPGPTELCEIFNEFKSLVIKHTSKGSNDAPTH